MIDIIIEVVVLSILFTALAIWSNIHHKRHVIMFMITHVVALLIALVISKIIYELQVKK